MAGVAYQYEKLAVLSVDYELLITELQGLPKGMLTGSSDANEAVKYTFKSDQPSSRG
jgi:hypothetical protein